LQQVLPGRVWQTFGRNPLKIARLENLIQFRQLLVVREQVVLLRPVGGGALVLGLLKGGVGFGFVARGLLDRIDLGVGDEQLGVVRL
jgi:hypothetical protein